MIRLLIADLKVGKLHAINISKGGVPKLATPSAWIGPNGVEGDGQRLRTHGGRDRAVCLYSLDLIQRLQAEGHPIAPGSIGENLTLAGLDWSLMTPGTEVAVGPVILEVTEYVTPCKNVSAYFANDDFMRVSQKAHPGWCRLYARVLEEGTVTPGVACEIRSSPNHQSHDTDNESRITVD